MELLECILEHPTLIVRSGVELADLMAFLSTENLFFAKELMKNMAVVFNRF